MIPLRDVIPSRTTPYITVAIIVLNALAWFFELSLPANQLPIFLQVYGVVPARFHVVTLLTSMFLHGSWMHLLGNMLYLWIFGDNVEEVLGHLRYLLVYLACGLSASLAHIALAPDSMIPSLGASGAIAGVMGMYLIWFPKNQVRVLVLRTITWMPALLVIGLWIVMQLVLGMGELSNAGKQGGVAYAAHVGGAAAGILFALVYRDRAHALGERPSNLGWASVRNRTPYNPSPYR
jgi:membrane associated rhomboid family serine protease